MPETNAWLESFQKLPPDAQQRVQAWIGTQMFIARELGLSREEWFKHVDWAFANPFDFSFMAGGLDRLAAAQDAMTKGGGQARAAASIGQDVSTSLPAPPAPAGKGARKAGLANLGMLSEMLPPPERRKKH